MSAPSTPPDPVQATRLLPVPWRAMAAWTLVAVAARVAWLLARPTGTAWDGIIYVRTAQRIAQGLGFVDSWSGRPPLHPTAFYPVGYPALLAVLYRVTGVHAWAAGALNVLAAAVTAACVVLLARRAAGRAGGHLAGALYALAPGAVVYVAATMTETVSGALLVASLVLAARHAREGRARDLVYAGLLLGAGGLVRPQALLLAPVVAWIAACGPGWRPRVRAVAITGLACVAVVAPWTARNCRQLDRCALVSVNGGSNLWIGTDPAAHGGYRDLRPREGCGLVLGEVAKDRCYARLALRRIARDPWGWIALAPAKVTELLDYEAAPVAYQQLATQGRAFGRHAARAITWITAGHRLLCALALLALLPLAGRGRWTLEERLAAGTVLASVLVHMVFFGGDRYHLVFTPLLAVLGGSVLRARDG